ncbi:hypothetical protein [Candidatus Aalborgicola defluviihabitans]|uniref:hypothetical protein n=1 Tax=Candidatus Aalborgicola defluviihabitans TaxID=3386187 RepID=UPI0039B972C2
MRSQRFGDALFTQSLYFRCCAGNDLACFHWQRAGFLQTLVSSHLHHAQITRTVTIVRAALARGW